MKPYLIIFLSLSSIGGALGCSDLLPPSNADYVRINHCAFHNYYPGWLSDKVYSGGEVHQSYHKGFKSYDCPNNVSVVIDDGEDQP